MQTDNSAAHMVVTNNVQPKRTKPMDMRFRWLRDRTSQQQFRYYWRPGPTNLGDYHTKHHPGSHHQNVRPEFITPRRVLEDLKRKQQLGKLTVNTAQSIAGFAPKVFALGTNPAIPRAVFTVSLPISCLRLSSSSTLHGLINSGLTF